MDSAAHACLLHAAYLLLHVCMPAPSLGAPRARRTRRYVHMDPGCARALGPPLDSPLRTHDNFFLFLSLLRSRPRSTRFRIMLASFYAYSADLVHPAPASQRSPSGNASDTDLLRTLDSRLIYIVQVPSYELLYCSTSRSRSQTNVLYILHLTHNPSLASHP